MSALICMLVGYWVILSIVAAVVFSLFMRPKSQEEIDRKMKEWNEETIRRLSGKDDQR